MRLSVSRDFGSAVFLLSVYFFSAQGAWGEASNGKATLQLGRGEQIQSYNIGQLKRRFPSVELHVSIHPAYENSSDPKRVRHYRGFSLKDVLRSLLPKGDSLKDYVLAATCLDGFDPVMKPELLAHLEKHEAVIAYEQKGGWEPIKAGWGIVSPGPFYLVWSTSEGVSFEGWPFQLKSLRLIKVSDYEAMVAKLNPPVEFKPGFDQFRGKCLTCHSLNGVGGKKASVDLVLKFRGFESAAQIESYLPVLFRNPPGGMRDVLDLKFAADDIRNLSRYLFQMSRSQ